VSRLHTALLSLDYASRASYYDDWRDAFIDHEAFDLRCFNIFAARDRSAFRKKLKDFDLIVVLHSCTADSLTFAGEVSAALGERRGVLVAFVGNEYNLPWVGMADKIGWLKKIHPDIIATQLLPEAGEWLYADIATRVLSLPHALNPAAFRPGPDPGARPLDIGVRCYRYPAFLGDDARNRAIDFFRRPEVSARLAVDIDTEERFPRPAWAEFLARCKATVSSEAGSWYLERDDATVLKVREFAVAGRRGIVLRSDGLPARLARHLPYPVRDRLKKALASGPVRHEALALDHLDFAEIHRRFFAGQPRAPVYSKCISSRHFDAVGTKTLQIMPEGRFNDILERDVHYVAVDPEGANFDSIARLLADPGAISEIVDRAYDSVLAAHTYRHRLAALLQAIG